MTLFRNWAQKIQIVIIALMTVLLVFDLCIIVGDSSTGVESTSEFIHASYVFLDWVQAALNLIIILCYALLFIKFLFMMSKKKREYGELRKQVIGFFTVILVILVVDFVCNMVFYLAFDTGDNNDTRLAQERQVSAITYINSLMDVTLNIVFLIFCISQASDGPQEGSLIGADPESANLLNQAQPLVSESLKARENRYSSPAETIKSGRHRDELLQEHEVQQEFTFDKQQEGGPIGHRKSTMQNLRRPQLSLAQVSASRGNSSNNVTAERAYVGDSATYDESCQHLVLSPHFQR